MHERLAIAGSGIQSWLIPVLHEVHGVGIEAASLALTGFLGGATGGVLLGGWFADRSDLLPEMRIEARRGAAQSPWSRYEAVICEAVQATIAQC